MLGIVSLLGVVNAGCAASSDAMQDMRAPLPSLPSPVDAIVVFVRPSTYARGDRYTVIDGQGRFLGHSLPMSWFEVRLEPGYHVFAARGENLSALRAWLSPGQTYFVEVSSKPGFFSSRVQLLSIAPRFDSWEKRESWLAHSIGYRVADPYGSGLEPEELEELAADAMEEIADYDPEDLDRRTLHAKDGTR